VFVSGVFAPDEDRCSFYERSAIRFRFIGVASSRVEQAISSRCPKGRIANRGQSRDALLPSPRKTWVALPPQRSRNRVSPLRKTSPCNRRYSGGVRDAAVSQEERLAFLTASAIFFLPASYGAVSHVAAFAARKPSTVSFVNGKREQQRHVGFLCIRIAPKPPARRCCARRSIAR